MSFWISVGSLVMFLGVAFGAFGAHGLKSVLSTEMKAVYQTGALYHLVHGLALLFVGVLLSQKAHQLIDLSGWAFLIGILLFSGSLYALSITGISKLGMITPFGGLLFLVGWALLLITHLK